MFWASFVTGFSAVTALGMIVIGAVLMSQGTRNNMIQFDLYNNGLIVLVIGLSLLFIFGCVLLYLLKGLRKERLENQHE